nr:uncharacterized protein LOC109621981 [Aedes albopictus]
MDIDTFLQVPVPPNISRSNIIPSQSQIICVIPGADMDQDEIEEEDIDNSTVQDDNDSMPNSDVKHIVAESLVEPDENVNPNCTDKRRCEEVTVLRGVKKHASSEMKFNSFQVNWNKISDNVVSRLQKLQDFCNQNSNLPAPKPLQISKTELSTLGNTVVDQLRTIDTCIRADVMEAAARQITSKFPCLNFVDDDGFGSKTGYIWLKLKMINRNTYLNRYREPNQPKASSGEVRRNRNLRAGTVKEYWQTSSKDCPKEILSALSRNEPELLTCDFLKASQSYVRYRLDEDKQLKDVLANLPVLRRRCLLYYHFECATGVKAESLEQYLSAKRAKIIDFSTNSRKFGPLDDNCTEYDMFKFFCRSVGEKIEDIVIVKEIGTKMDGISVECSGPVLVAIECVNGKRVHYVFAEQVRLTEGTENLVVAVTELMCVHYVHNFMYMKQISKFMEFIQEYFFKILPTKGSKSNATRKLQQQRVVKRLIQAIATHDSSS